MANKKSDDLIVKFIEDLIKEVGLEDGSKEDVAKYKDDLMGLLQKKLGIEMMKMLSDEHIDEYIKLIEKKPKTDELYDFFSQRIPDFNNKVIVVLNEFKKEFINSSENFESI